MYDIVVQRYGNVWKGFEAWIILPIFVWYGFEGGLVKRQRSSKLGHTYHMVWIVWDSFAYSLYGRVWKGF